MTMDNGMDVSPSWEELRKERDEAFAKGKQAFEDLRRVEAERNALTAHLDHIRAVREQSKSDDPFKATEGFSALDIALNRRPETYLAHLKAKWQADAVSEYAFHYLGGHEQELAEIYAGKLRRQAEGDE